MQTLTYRLEARTNSFWNYQYFKDKGTEML